MQSNDIICIAFKQKCLCLCLWCVGARCIIIYISSRLTLHIWITLKMINLCSRRDKRRGINYEQSHSTMKCHWGQRTEREWADVNGRLASPEFLHWEINLLGPSICAYTHSLSLSRSFSLSYCSSKLAISKSSTGYPLAGIIRNWHSLWLLFCVDFYS